MGCENYLVKVCLSYVIEATQSSFRRNIGREDSKAGATTRPEDAWNTAPESSQESKSLSTLFRALVSHSNFLPKVHLIFRCMSVLCILVLLPPALGGSTEQVLT